MTISNGINGSGGSGQALMFGGSGNVTVSSAIGSNIGAVTKDGSGTLTLSGTNTYTGATTANNGLLVINNSSALPTGSALAIGSGGSVVLGDAVLGGSAIVEGSGPPVAVPRPPADVHAVPEPGTLVLLAAAAACGFALRRKVEGGRRKNRKRAKLMESAVSWERLTTWSRKMAASNSTPPSTFRLPPLNSAAVAGR